MLPASNRGMGGDVHFPDICKTPMPPPIGMLPIPYPNLAFNMMAVTFSANVFWTFMPALNMASRIAMSTGDEPGSLGGLISGIIKGMAGLWMGNPVVSVNGIPAKNLLCPTHSNNYNATMGLSAIPSLTNVLLTDREGEAGSMERDGLPFMADEALRSTQRRLCRKDAVSLVEQRDGVTVVRIDTMVVDASRQLFNVLERRRDSTRALVIDLRGNPGGDGRACLQLCDDWLPHGTLLAWRDAAGERTALYARQDEPYPLPLALLIDGTTASAAELFAGILQHHRRARVFGARSWGKGRIQELGPRRAEGVAYDTVAELLLADGSSIEGCGVEPDVLADCDEALALAVQWAREAASVD